MANFGRRPITDAGKPKPTVTYYYDGEERLDRRPLGRVERFVDAVGNVVSLQLAGDGDPVRQMTADKMRLQYRRDGFVEHAKCPLRHGTHLMAGPIAKDFSSMPASLGEPCAADSRTMVRRGHELHATKACPHIEWLIEARRAKELEQAKKRNANRIAQEQQAAEEAELKRLQLEMAKEQIEERKQSKRTRGRQPQVTEE